MIKRSLLLLSAAPLRTLALDNELQTGPSKNYKEIMIGNGMKDPSRLMDNVNSSHQLVLILYSDKCQHCQEIKPQQEKAARKILEEYPRQVHYEVFKEKRNITHHPVKFARIDIYREIHWKLENELKNNYPDYETIREFGSPQAYLFKPFLGGISEIPHASLGWGADGYKSMREWFRKNLNDGQGYVWKKKHKLAVLGEDWKKIEEETKDEL